MTCASTPQAFYQLPAPAAQLPANAAGPAVLLGLVKQVTQIARQRQSVVLDHLGALVPLTHCRFRPPKAALCVS